MGHREIQAAVLSYSEMELLRALAQSGTRRQDTLDESVIAGSIATISQSHQFVKLIVEIFNLSCSA